MELLTTELENKGERKEYVNPKENLSLILLLKSRSGKLSVCLLWTDEAAWYKSVESELQESDWAKLPSLSLAWGFPCGLVVKNLPVMQEIQELWVRLLGQEGPSEEGMTTLSWRMPRTEEPGRLQSIGLQRIGHDWSGWAPMHVCLGMHGYRVLQKVRSTPELHPWGCFVYFISSKKEYS